MSYEQRVEHMRTVIVPGVQEMFDTRDPDHGTEYQLITCERCHGEDGESRRYAMPNLPAVDTSYGAETSSRFLDEHVIPWLLDELGYEPEDVATPAGLGCNLCHLPMDGPG